MNLILIPIVLIVFLIVIFIPKESLSEEYTSKLIESVNRKEAILKNIDALYKEWDILIKKRSQAIKDMDFEKHKVINEDIDFINLKIENLIKEAKNK